MSVTLPGEEGAVKSPVELTVPAEAVHDELVAVLSRYAVNCTDCPTGTLGEPGKIVSAPFTGVVWPPPPPPPHATSKTIPNIAATNAMERTRFRISNLPFAPNEFRSRSSNVMLNKFMPRRARTWRYASSLGSRAVAPTCEVRPAYRYFLFAAMPQKVPRLRGTPQRWSCGPALRYSLAGIGFSGVRNPEF